MKLLLDYGADIEAATSMKRKAIHFAILSGELHYVDYLVRCGADCDSIDMDKDSPLHYASRLGNSLMVEYFLSKYVKITKNIYNETPVDIAVNIGIFKVIIHKQDFPKIFGYG
jgi:ankyrin repeat protein